uniref:Secreted frizzled-related protein D HduSFRPd n=1 Tax=Halisarca dujardinii TaxID=2583056 RepID=A0A8F8AQ90_HALDU|nr:secreted frizzled-related protein D HduSFRPd [Halisarca dujardinii]
MTRSLSVVFLIGLSLAGINGAPSEFEVNTCTKYSSTFCRPPRIGRTYNETSFRDGASVTGVESADEAEKTLLTYEHLIRINCHPFLADFLCLSYYPFCKGSYKVSPCQQFCEDVRDKCVGYLQAIGREWPSQLTCSKYPQSPSLCFSLPEYPRECKTCFMEGKSNADVRNAIRRSMCDPASPWNFYAVVNVTDKKVFSGRIAYTAIVERKYKPRPVSGASGSKPTVTIITESTSDCPCIEMSIGNSYLIGGLYIPSSPQSFYVVPNEAAVYRWNPKRTRFQEDPLHQ